MSNKKEKMIYCTKKQNVLIDCPRFLKNIPSYTTSMLFSPQNLTAHQIHAEIPV